MTPQPSRKSMLETAQSYARYGWRVFPTKDKRPVIKGVGLRQATTDTTLIQDWWSGHPNAQISVATGRESNLFVIDLDAKNNTNGMETWVRLYGKLPKTKYQTTPHGIHLFFSYPPLQTTTDESPEFRLGCSIGKIGPGIDTKGEGGAVVMCPSKGYQFGPRTLPLLPIPQEIIEFFRPKAKPRVQQYIPKTQMTSSYANATLRHLIDDLQSAPQGTRNDKLNALAYRLGRLTVSGRMPVAAGKELKAAALEIGLDELEVERTFDSGYNAGIKAG